MMMILMIGLDLLLSIKGDLPEPGSVVDDFDFITFMKSGECCVGVRVFVPCGEVDENTVEMFAVLVGCTYHVDATYDTEVKLIENPANTLFINIGKYTGNTKDDWG